MAANLLTPRSGDGPFPLVLFQSGEAGRAAAVPDSVASWALDGVAVASVDLPLHGERASSKLTERLLCGLAGSQESGSPWWVLWNEFLRQSIGDLGRALDALTQLDDVSGDRIVCVATKLGAITTAAFVSSDPRPSAAALAPRSGKASPAEAAACESLNGFSGRPLLIVDSGARTDGDSVARILELASAQSSPTLRLEPGEESELAAVTAMAGFVRDQLGGLLSPASGG